MSHCPQLPASHFTLSTACGMRVILRTGENGEDTFQIRLYYTCITISTVLLSVLIGCSKVMALKCDNGFLKFLKGDNGY